MGQNMNVTFESAPSNVICLNIHNSFSEVLPILRIHVNTFH